ncbi:MAG: hypothetical protein IJT94_00540 [Oscillibacter sp.]|nr:hypothetical protein [Oscillibacter sp.]
MNRTASDRTAGRRGDIIKRRITVLVFLLCFVLFAANLAYLRFRLLNHMQDPANRPAGELHLVAHRGYTLEAPENTLSAFLAAAEAGYRCVETDVRFTADGAAVLIHNAAVDDLSDGTGAVADLTLDELLALDFGYGAGERFQGERIPTLDEGLELCRQLGLDVYLELKIPSMTAEQCRMVSDAVKAHEMEEYVTFSSFYLDSLRGMAARNPSCGYQFLTPGGVADMMSVLQAIDWLQSLGETASGVSIGWEYRHVLSEMAGMASQSGVALEAWTVDDTEQLDSLPAVFSGVITNRITPEALAAWQAERGYEGETGTVREIREQE